MLGRNLSKIAPLHVMKTCMLGKYDRICRSVVLKGATFRLAAAVPMVIYPNEIKETLCRPVHNEYKTNRRNRTLSGFTFIKRGMRQRDRIFLFL